MFCRKCGNELNDEALFCPQCGSACRETPAHIPSEQENADKADRVAASFASAVDGAKRRSRRQMPTIVLVALALALLSGLAYAAYVVYKEISESQMQDETAVEQPSEDAEEAESDTTTVVEGNPEHILQIAEILAMNPTEVSAFLESQGLSFEEKDSLRGPFSASGSSWTCTTDNGAPFAAAESAGAPIHLQTQGGREMAITFGVDVPAPHNYQYADLSRYDITKEDLANGEAATSIFVWNVPLAMMDDEQLATFLEACNLSQAAASYVIEGTDRSPGDAKVHTGTVEIEEQSYYWYLVQYGKYGLEGPAESFFGCFSANEAPQVISDSALYTDSEWEQADEEMRALMVGQSIAQGNYVRDGGYRVNVRSGEIEALSPFPTKDSTDVEYVNREKFAEINGEELARERFDAVFG